MNPACRFLLIFIILHLSAVESQSPSGHFCGDNANANANTQIARNIDTLLGRLVQGATQKGFLATSYGKGSDQVYGLAQCRGDVGRQDCSDCIRNATRESRSLCPTQADVRIWYDFCFLKYNTNNFFGAVDTSPAIFYWNIQNATDADAFNQKLGALMDKIDSEAIRPANRGLGKGQSRLSDFTTLYALVQCTRDLSPINCAQCLAIAIGNFPVYCNNKIGCRVLFGSCYVRYELYPFFFPLDAQKATGYIPANYRSFNVYKPR